MRLAHFHAQKGEAERAIELAKAVLDESQKSTAYKILIDILITFDRFSAAERYAEEASRRFPDMAAFPCYWATARRKGNKELDGEDLEEVIEAYRLALRLDPHHADAAARLGALFTFHGRIDEGLLLMRTAAEWQPNDGWLNLSVAERLWNTGHIAEAGEAFKRSLACPDATEYFYVLYMDYLRSTSGE